MNSSLHFRRILIAAVAALTLVGVVACNGNANTNAEGAIASVPVRLGEVSAGPALPAIQTSGTVAAKDELRLAVKVGGVLRRISVSEGERVQRGQRLAELELTEVQATVEQARQAHIKAKQDLTRGEKLYAEQVVTLDQLESLRAAEASAAAALQAARFNASHAVIEAPRDGVIQRRLAEAGETVAAGTPILVLGADDQGYVIRASLSDRELVQLDNGDPADVRLDAYPGETLRGSVSMLSAAADPRSGTFPVEIDVQADGRRLVSGMVAKVELTPSKAEQSSLAYVPIAAIVEGNGQRASVYGVVEGRAKRISVDVAFIDSDRVALSSGPAVGDQVVTDGALFLADGDLVRVHN